MTCLPYLPTITIPSHLFPSIPGLVESTIMYPVVLADPVVRVSNRKRDKLREHAFGWLVSFELAAHEDAGCGQLGRERDGELG